MHQLCGWREQVHRDLEGRDVLAAGAAVLLLLRMLQEVEDNKVSAVIFMAVSMIRFDFRQKFKILRFLVLQMAVVHVLIFLALNVIAIESPERIDNILQFFMPFIAVTIILGVWAFQITIRMVVPYYENLNLLKKFISFQLVLVFCKLQPVVLNLILKQLVDECDGPFTVVVKIRGKWNPINMKICYS